MLPIEQSCYWLATRPQSAQGEALIGAQRAQVVIVGAGFTGLWTAHFLKSLKPDLDLAIVEQGVTGYGATGRNAGMISNCIDHTHSLAIAHFGQEEARELAAIGLANINEMESYATDCDLERTGQLFVALKEKHMHDLHSLIEDAERLEIKGYQLFDQKEIQTKLNSPRYVGGAHVPGGGILNPIKLVDKLASDLKRSGVRIFEKTRVDSVHQGQIKAGDASIQADKIILATDAYTHHLLPGLIWRFIPLYDYILVSEPLEKSELEKLGWQGREGIVDGRTFFNYYRLTADNRVLWGTSEAKYYAPNQVNERFDHSHEHYQALKESFSWHFPQLKPMQWPYAWGGPIASTTRLTPFFGTAHNGSVLYALGYTGHGIGSTRLAGKILAHMALERPSTLLKLKMVTDKPMPYPPEPLRSLSVNMVTSSLRHVDQGAKPNLLLKILDALGIGFSS